jgi:hypothetical protein
MALKTTARPAARADTAARTNANKPTPKATVTAKTAAAGWAPKAGAAKGTSTVGWTNKDGPKALAGQFTAKGDGFKSFSLKADGSFAAKTSDGKTLAGTFGVGRGGAAFGDTLALKGADGGLRLFSVDTVTRDAKGRVTSLSLAEFKNGSPTDLEPMTLTRQ